MRPLGKEQLRIMLAMGSPSMLLVTPPGRSEKALVKRGLLSRTKGGAHRITPAGMRALADAFEAGKLEQFMRKAV